MIKHSVKILLVAIIGTSALSGCGSKRQLSRLQSENTPDEYLYSNNSLQIDTSENIAEVSYSDFFQDKELVNLIDIALANNNNMLSALKQIEFAEESMKQIRWNYLPIVDLTIGNATLTRPSDNSLNAGMSRKSYIEDYTTALNVSWEADIWGKIKNQNAEALAAYLETTEAVNAIRTSLISGVAQSYYNLLLFDQQKLISEQNLSLIDSTLEITKVQLRLGLTNSLAVQQLENSRDNLQKSIRVIEENIAIQELSLNALMGSMPRLNQNRGRLSEISSRNSFELGVPANLVSRRPDIKQAEYRLARSLAGIKVARANMYPALRITAQGGLNSFKASDWFKIPGSLFGMVSGSLTQPLFQGRQLKTAYNQAQIVAEQSELEFKESVLQAVTEVSTILEKISSLENQQVYNNQLVTRNNELIRDAHTLFKNDMATYIDILVAQQSKLQAELDQSLVKSQLLQTEVALYKALGGGIN